MNVIDLVRRHGIEPKRAASTKGGEYHSPCPGCGGTDRFHVWPQENPEKEMGGAYWCRQCGKGGDAIQFLRDFENMSYQRACRAVGRDLPDAGAGLRPPRKQKWEPQEREASGDLAAPDLWREKAKKFVLWSFESLFEHREAEQYLAGRGIPIDAACRFGLGWNPGDKKGDLYRNRESWGLSGLVSDEGKLRALWLPVGLVVPCFKAKAVCRIRIRRAGELVFGPRYYVVPGSTMKTMVIEDQRSKLKAQGVYVVVESELDAMMIAEQAGDLCGVVALGSSNTKPDPEATEILRNAACVLNALDNDRAGAQGWKWWKEEFPDSERWPVPNGKDPGEAFQAGVDIREWVRAGLPEGLRMKGE